MHHLQAKAHHQHPLFNQDFTKLEKLSVEKEKLEVLKKFHMS